MNQSLPGTPPDPSSGIQASTLAALKRYIFDKEKALHYIEVLAECYNYTEIAHKVILPLYMDGTIDDATATRSDFIQTLLPLSSLPRSAKAHSVIYHVRKVLQEKSARQTRNMTQTIRALESFLPAQDALRINDTGTDLHVGVPVLNPDTTEKIVRFALQHQASVEIRIKFP